jgi:4-amino-4-deoxy-L-arabinose transferase-like glycosyltransferase
VPRRSFRAALVAIAAAGFAARAVVVLAVAPDSRTDVGDPRFFHLAANLLADGHGYIIPAQWLDSGASIPATEHPPLWSGVLALFSLLGLRGEHAHALVGCGIGAVTAVCAGLIARRVWSDRAGLIAAALCAGYPVFIAMDGSLMSEPLYALCVALVLLATLRAIERPSLGRSAVLGIAIGVTALVRSEAVALVVLLGVPMAIVLRTRRVAHLAAVATAAVLVVAPWAIRNWAATDRPVFVSSEDGSVLAGANCDLTYHGYNTGYWRADCLPHRHDRNSAYASARLRRVGLDYVGDHAGRLPAVEGVRLLRTFGLWQPRRHVYFAEGRKLPGRTVAVIACWVVFALAAAGGRLLARADRRRLAILLAPLAVAVLTTLLAFGYPRFRYAADVSLLVLAAIALDRAWALRAARSPTGGRRPGT